MGMAHQTITPFLWRTGPTVTWFATILSATSPGVTTIRMKVSRYPELTFSRVPDIPSHMQLVGNELYYVDTGTGTFASNVSTGRQVRILIPDNERSLSSMRWVMSNIGFLCQASTYLQGWW